MFHVITQNTFIQVFNLIIRHLGTLTLSLILMHLLQAAFENIVTKGEIATNDFLMSSAANASENSCLWESVNWVKGGILFKQFT